MEPPKTIRDWLGSEVLWWKWFGSLFWSLFFQLLGLLCLNSHIIAPSYWLYDVLIGVCLAALLTDYYDAFWSRFSRMRSVGSLFLHALGGGILLWAYGQVFGVSDSFLTFSGTYFGVFKWYSLHFNRQSAYIFDFPWLQLPKKSVVRSKFPSIVKGSAISVISQLRFYLLLYVSVFHRHETDWYSYLQSLAYLSLTAIFLNTILLTILGTLHLLLNVYLTEPISFSLPLLLPAMDYKHNFPLLRHLACQDFALSMEEQSPSRRAVFFTLSQPGGHPYNWNSIRSQCEVAIGEFTEALHRITNPKKDAPTNDIIASPISPKTDLRFRRLVSPPVSTSTPIIAEKPKEEKKTPPSRTLSKMIMDRISSFTAIPDAVRVREVFSQHSETLMWIVEGLSNLIAHSVAEDRYGVVQKDLASVLSLLFNLQQVIERHKGMAVNARKNKSEAKDSHIKNSLRNTVKKSLYRITIAYKDHISDIPGLSSDHQQKMRNFYAFME